MADKSKKENRNIQWNMIPSSALPANRIPFPGKLVKTTKQPALAAKRNPETRIWLLQEIDARLRKKPELSQTAELARQVGLSRISVSRVARDRRKALGILLKPKTSGTPKRRR